ncbi:MAG: toprim domain-containing protein [Pilosibacter sp.]
MLVCEGYVDVIAYAPGRIYECRWHLLGTAFTSQHAMLLKRYTDQVSPDLRTATERAVEGGAPGDPDL